MAFSLASASDPSPLQDFCVAVNDTNAAGIIIMSSLYSSCPFEIHSLTYTLIFPRLLFVNGKFCKDPKLATPNDFFFSGLRVPGNTSNKLGSMVTPANNPGVITIANAVFGSKPAISADVLTKAFQLDKNVVAYLQSQFWTDNHTY
ncbi:hypothetical protein AAG906_010691 [Vitis piasezkii]